MDRKKDVKIADSIIPFQNGWSDGEFDQLFYFDPSVINHGEMMVRAWSVNGDTPGGKLVDTMYADYVKSLSFVNFDKHISCLVTDLIRGSQDGDLLKEFGIKK